MALPTISIGIVLHDSIRYIPYFLPSLFFQDYKGKIEFLFRDQSSDGSSLKFVKSNFPEIFDKCYFETGDNLFHSGGHNRLISLMKGDYYFCCSYDMLYSKNFVSGIVNKINDFESFGTATCKIKKWDFDLNLSKSNILDSCGIGIKKYHNFFDIGQGETDKGQYDNNLRIFGASGALLIIKKSTIDFLLKNDGFVFDEVNVKHYKNDVDLAYRLNWYGFNSIFIPNVEVFHDRQVGKKGNSFFSKLKNRLSLSGFKSKSSFLGHLCILRKNFTFKFPFFVIFSTFLYEFAKFFVLIFFNLKNLKEYFVFFKKIYTIKCSYKDYKHTKKIVNFMN